MLYSSSFKLNTNYSSHSLCVIIMPMKLNILLSILFAIVTSFAAIHEVEHIKHNDGSSCLICTVNHNLVSDDAITSVYDVELFHFGAIAHIAPISYIHTQAKSNQSRAPPKLS